MKIANVQNNVLFGRALTSKEKKEFTQLQQQARKELGLDKTIATTFDFSFPTSEHDTGIGTSFSDDAQKTAQMFKTMCGVNAIQLQPQGEISNFVRSPYSGTSFSLGSHLIDLTKLQDREYGSLLTKEDLDKPYLNRVSDHSTVDYDNVFAQDGQKAVLETAYAKFKKLDETHPLKQEFEQFKKENSYWLEKDALFDAAAEENKTDDASQWPKRDRNVFATKEGDRERIAELKKVENKNGNNVVELSEFIQFIADKQQKESKANFNAKGIDIYGDCQIGFSQKDVWAHKSAFYDNLEFGCDIGDNKYSCWSPAINFDKLNGEAGELLYNKFDRFFKKYDGVRIDAAWQLVNPTIVKPTGEFDQNGNKLGTLVNNQKNVGDKIINGIIKKAGKDNNIKPNKIFLEMLGGNSYASLDAIKGNGMELIHITRYGSDSWGRVKHYEANNPQNKYQNMKKGQYILGPGTHDDTTLIEQARVANGNGGANRVEYLAKDLHLDKNRLYSSEKERSAAICAELFTTSNQFMTAPDIVGSSRRINVPNTQAGNWEYRLSSDYEKEYHQNLAQQKGLNYADALSKALKAKNGRDTTLSRSLEKFASILKDPNGPMTTKEADEKFNVNA